MPGSAKPDWTDQRLEKILNTLTIHYGDRIAAN
jgi:hypothetical protein